jgi:hypothetical protein
MRGICTYKKHVRCQLTQNTKAELAKTKPYTEYAEISPCRTTAFNCTAGTGWLAVLGSCRMPRSALLGHTWPMAHGLAHDGAVAAAAAAAAAYYVLLVVLVGVRRTAYGAWRAPRPAARPRAPTRAPKQQQQAASSNQAKRARRAPGAGRRSAVGPPAPRSGSRLAQEARIGAVFIF